MRSPLCIVMFAVCLIAVYCTANEGETGEGDTPSVITPPVPLSPPSLPTADANPTSQSNTGSGGDLVGSNGKDLLDGGSAAKPENTTTTSNPANAANENKTRVNERGAPQQGGPQPGLNLDPSSITQDAVTNEQTQSQPHLSQTNTDQTDTEDRNPPAHTAKEPTSPVEPLVSPAATETTTIAPSGATLAGAADPESSQERALTDITLTGGGAHQQQPDRLGQTQDNTATTTRTQTGTHPPPPITPQDPKHNPVGTTPVSPPPPQPTRITGDNALAKATDPKLSTPATTPQLQSPVTGQTSRTNAAAAADPVPTKATTSAKSTAHDGQNLTNTDSGVKNKIHALTLKSTTSTAAPEDSLQTSFISTTESVKEEYASAANMLPKLPKKLQHVDMKDGSISSLSLSALTVLLTLTVMAVAPVS